jgi:twitching motility protein PilT
VAEIAELVQTMVDHRASDLHLKPGAPPFIRVNGKLLSLEFSALSAGELDGLANGLLPEHRKIDFEETGEADFAIGVSGIGRFRVSVMRQRGSIGIVLRRVPTTAPSFDVLGLPQQVRQLAERRTGLILITGPADSGKSTTVATMINHINEHSPVSIITIEDPIEILYADKTAYVSQREVGTDTKSYARGLASVLRHDPDVIVLDKIDSADTMGAVLSAASGRLVISTLPSLNASDTIQRIVDYFSPHQARQIRQSLSATLQGVISQRLIDREDGQGRVAAFELMISTSRIRDSIVEALGSLEIEHLIATGDYYGMQTLDQHLTELHKNRVISTRDALSAATHPHDLRVQLQSGGAGPNSEYQ